MANNNNSNSNKQTTVSNAPAPGANGTTAAAQSTPATPASNAPATPPATPPVGANGTANAVIQAAPLQPVIQPKKANTAAPALTQQQQQLLQQLTNLSSVAGIPASIGNGFTAAQMLAVLAKRQITAAYLAMPNVYAFNLVVRYRQAPLIGMLLNHLGLQGSITKNGKHHYIACNATFMQVAAFYCMVQYYYNLLTGYYHVQAVQQLATAHGFTVPTAAQAVVNEILS